MKQITRHPLFTVADMLKRTFVLNGFHLFDDGQLPEIVLADQDQKLYSIPEEEMMKTIFLDEGKYVLRTSLLLMQLQKMKTKSTIKEIICGRVYDGNDEKQPDHLHIEGVCSESGMTLKDYKSFWNKMASGIYGIGAKAELEPVSENTFKIVIDKDGVNKVTVGVTGFGNWLVKGLLDRTDDVWIFTIDIDRIAMDIFEMQDRDELYCNKIEKLKEYTDYAPAYGDDFIGVVTDTLRDMGYIEYIGPKVYPADAYIKMNMFQDAWDRNNKGMPLVEPLGDRMATPTVLTPGLEYVLGQNYTDQEKTVKIFEIAHIFVPGEGDNPPEEKIALSIGGYGPELDPKAFKEDMDIFLTRIGIQNHFFIPTGIPIPYKPGECWLVLDEKPGYLGGNFGGICAIAEENFGIGVHASMANFEIEPLKKKAAIEYKFTPPELM